MIKNILYKIKNKILYYFRFIRNRPMRTSYGARNPDKLFYVIGISFNTEGLFAIVKSVLSHIIYAREKGYIPVVNMRDFSNQYIEAGQEGIQNSWELFFEQPMGYRLEDIEECKNIIMSRNNLVPSSRYGIYVKMLEDKRKFSKLSSYYTQYIRFNGATKKFLEEEKRRLLNGYTTLGILCRGTDYIQKKPSGHPVQPNPEDVVHKAEAIYSQLKYDKIYLATEDQKIYNLFKKRFGDTVITNGQNLYDNIDSIQFLSEIKGLRKREEYEKGIEYLSSVYILSECDYFIGGRTAGTLGVYFMSKGFKYNFLWNLGYYPFK